MSAGSRFNAAQYISEGIMGGARAITSGMKEKQKREDEAPFKNLRLENATLQKALTEQNIDLNELKLGAAEAKKTEDAEVKQKIKTFVTLVSDPIMKEKVLDRPEFKQALMRGLGGAEAPSRQSEAPTENVPTAPRTLTPNQKLQKAQEIGLAGYADRPEVKGILDPIREQAKFKRDEESDVAAEERGFGRDKDMEEIKHQNRIELDNIKNKARLAEKELAADIKTKAQKGKVAKDVKGLMDLGVAFDQLQEEHKAIWSGPVGGFIGRANVIGTDRAKFNATRALVLKTIARSFEGARMSDIDMTFYNKMVPKDMHTDKQFEEIKTSIENLVAWRIKRFNDSGGDDPGAVPVEKKGEDGAVSETNEFDDLWKKYD